MPSCRFKSASLAAVGIQRENPLVGFSYSIQNQRPKSIHLPSTYKHRITSPEKLLFYHFTTFKKESHHRKLWSVTLWSSVLRWLDGACIAVKDRVWTQIRTALYSVCSFCVCSWFIIDLGFESLRISCLNVFLLNCIVYFSFSLEMLCCLNSETIP